MGRSRPQGTLRPQRQARERPARRTTSTSAGWALSFHSLGTALPQAAQLTQILRFIRTVPCCCLCRPCSFSVAEDPTVGGVLAAARYAEVSGRHVLADCRSRRRVGAG